MIRNKMMTTANGFCINLSSRANDMTRHDLQTYRRDVLIDEINDLSDADAKFFSYILLYAYALSHRTEYNTLSTNRILNITAVMHINLVQEMDYPIQIIQADKNRWLVGTVGVDEILDKAMGPFIAYECLRYVQSTRKHYMEQLRNILEWKISDMNISQFKAELDNVLFGG